MSWTRYDDLFTERPEFDGLSYEARWHYIALVQMCSRARRWDGELPLVRARRASDVPDPDRCHDELEVAGLVTRNESRGYAVTIVNADEYLPPKSIRENAERSKLRMRRKRAHDRGDHGLCLPENCASAPAENGDTPNVTSNPGTGRDGTLRRATPYGPVGSGDPARNAEEPEPWPHVRKPGSAA